tara:strand:+ start:1233 stop:1436 length:204 start_codon:yes stop_codon:yes gene_type:complete
MDFLKELIEINNVYTLDKIANKQNLEKEEHVKFIEKYNKSNNRLFTPCKKYKIDDYKLRLERYQLSR